MCSWFWFEKADEINFGKVASFTFPSGNVVVRENQSERESQLFKKWISNWNQKGEDQRGPGD
jgi:hypothetical protein